MTTVLLAVGDPNLRSACSQLLKDEGHIVLLLGRPLEPLSLVKLVHWDAALVDASEMGRDSILALSLVSVAPLVGLGFTDPRLKATVLLPLQSSVLASTFEQLLFGPKPAESSLKLDSMRRLAFANDRQVLLTRIEFRLLQLLLDRSPSDVPLFEVLTTVWGTAEGEATSELVRSHLRNVRRKLRQIGLPDAVRSRRGLGYSLHL